LPWFGAPVREPVDQPRVAVVGEDDRAVGREERVELASESRADARLRLQAHQVDDVDHAHLELGQVLAQQRSRRERLERRRVAGTPEHDVRLAAVVDDAQSQTPSPRVQWTMASSIGR
jgi:hypothetical protein